MELTYSRQGNYYLPNILAEEKSVSIGKYGMMRLDYLKKNHKVIYTSMLMKGTLYEHLREIDRQAREQVEMLVKRMAENEGCDESLKEKDQMKWVGLMNNYKACAEESVVNKYFYLKQKAD